MIDFGVSKQISNYFQEEYKGIDKNAHTGFTGTLSYMAPELVAKRKWGEYFTYDPIKSDMWSVGVTLYQMVVQDLPFKG